MKNFKRVLLLLPILFLAFSCQDDMEDVVDDGDDDNNDDNSINIVAMMVDNSGASAYFVSSISGNEDLTALNEDNSPWELTVGTRYELTVTGASTHPFALRDGDNNILLSMNDVDGSFESDSDVDFQTSGTSFNFTLTQELADELNNYVCTIHSGMTGSISIN
ncbi:cupredoxin domain-containing protein [Marivirga sp.]|uniref:cupredoxin domain-containing protein n=1 Tax=Marivirga sp. TaxID=2018662 RepID=UPI003DA72972